MWRDVRPIIARNGAPYHQMTSVGLHSPPGREKEDCVNIGNAIGHVFNVDQFHNDLKLAVVLIFETQ